MARIDDAVRRNLKQEARLKLWGNPSRIPRSPAAWLARAPGAGARGRSAKRGPAQESRRRAAPAKNGHILVVGSKADDMGIQCGGWTVSWAGRRGNVTPGTTILRAIEKAAVGGKVKFAPGVRGADAADAIVVVVGEEPYAEGTGDRKDLGLSRDDLSLITAAKGFRQESRGCSHHRAAPAD